MKKLTNLTELRLSHVLFNNPNGQLPTIERLHLSNIFENNSVKLLLKLSRIFPNITEVNSVRINLHNWSMWKELGTSIWI